MATIDNSWRPIRFDADTEAAYAQHLLKRFVPLARLAILISIGAFIGFMAWDQMLAPDGVARTLPWRLVAITVFVVAYALTYLDALSTNPRAWFWYIFGIYTSIPTLFTLVLGQLPDGFVAGSPGLLLGMIFVPTVISGAKHATGILVPYLTCCIGTMVVLGGDPFAVINAFAWTGSGVVFAIGFAYLLDVLNRRSFQLEQLLEAEKQASEALLLNILPADIAERLKAEEHPLANSHDSATVLFADLAGFTDLSRKMTASDLVAMLNDLFSAFDDLAFQHGAEKIKTIGDAYMVAAGLVPDQEDHADRMGRLALGMQQAFKDFTDRHGLSISLRIGIHSGQVVAGVIGKRKFAFDLWGDTVNLASRMESTGLPDQIQISAETRERLSARFHVTERGEVEIKGHQPHQTYFLKGLTAQDPVPNQ